MPRRYSGTRCPDCAARLRTGGRLAMARHLDALTGICGAAASCRPRALAGCGRARGFSGGRPVFVLSGFVLALAYHDRLHADFRARLGEFLMNRVHPAAALGVPGRLRAALRVLSARLVGPGPVHPGDLSPWWRLLCRIGAFTPPWRGTIRPGR